MRNIIKIFLYVSLIGILLIGVAIYLTYYRPAVEYDKTLEISGLDAEVSIVWDDDKVPHVFASSDADLYFAVGYIHAQERLWQMTITQLGVDGRFAEFFGTKAISFDRLSLTVGFRQVAESIYKQLPEQEKQRLQRYADGVNHWIAEHPEQLPIEFSLFGFKPIKWSPIHTIGAWRLMAWEANASWKTDLTYSYLQKKIGDPGWRTFLPGATPLVPSITPSDSVTVEMDSTLIQPEVEQDPEAAKISQWLDIHRNFLSILGRQEGHFGSNAWVINARKSATGFPILVNDPHQSLGLPSRLYEMHLNKNGQNLTGVTIPGIPYTINGQNGSMAWAFTHLLSDQTDFFEEQVSRQNPELFRSYGSDSLNYKPFKKIRKQIKVKDSEDVVLTVRLTDQGPIINDLIDLPVEPNQQLLSMRWVGQQPGNELFALYQLNWSDRLANVRTLLPEFIVPGLSFMYADVSGNIAQFILGRFPVRTGESVVPVPAWTQASTWEGYIPFNELPNNVNPPEGIIVHANQRIESNAYIGFFYEPDSRYRVIREALNASPKLTVEDMKTLQLETLSAHARDNTRIIVASISKSNRSKAVNEALNYLINWDYRYDKAAAAATIFELTFRNIAKNTLKDEMGEAAWNAFIRSDQLPLRLTSELLASDSELFDNKLTPWRENRDSVIQRSMRESVRFLIDSLGTQTIQWRWENVHTLEFQPPMIESLSHSTAWNQIHRIIHHQFVRGPFGMQGHTTSPINGQYRWEDPFRMIVGASHRRIVDLSDLNRSWSILPGGQSGNPLQDHYDNQLDRWLEGEYRLFEHASDIRYKENVPLTRLIPQVAK